MLASRLLRSPLHRVLALVALVASLAASGCSSKAEGDVACDGGVCTPKPVFASGILSAVLVTPYAVYVAEKSTCSLFVADKPLRTARGIVKNACNVSALARTDGALFWTSVPYATEQEKNPKGMLAMVSDDGAEPLVIDPALEKPRGIAVLGGDTVYVAVTGGVRKVAPGSRQLEVVLDEPSPPQALRAFDGALYWHDGFRNIFRWRPGEAKATTIVENADLRSPSTLTFEREAFEVDASGIYWMSSDFFGAGSTMQHVLLSGGAAGTILKPAGYIRSIGLDADHVYWSEADQYLLPKNTNISRMPKSDLGRATVVGALTGAVDALQVATEGLYIAASPLLNDFDFEKLRFQRYGGPLLVLPRAVLDAL